MIERVEAARGNVLAVDVGEVTNGTAGQWLSGTLLGGSHLRDNQDGNGCAWPRGCRARR
jgi:hypothetical protein